MVNRQAQKDAVARQAMVESPKERIKNNSKGLVGNRGHARYIKVNKGGMTINQKKIDGQARFDGKWVLRTNMDLAAEKSTLKYKELWQVRAGLSSIRQSGIAADYSRYLKNFACCSI